jgi:glutathione synthase/RimK-type ligase-like ATP-grasp enzyme
MSAPRRVALACCAELPELDDDDRLLLAPLAARGVQAVPRVWDDPVATWDDVDLVVLRETWDYPERHVDFLAWLDAIPVPVANPVPLVRWNTDKRYLADLAAAGAPVVPTALVAPGGEAVLPATGEYVVKPSVSCGSRDTARYAAGEDADAALAHIRRLHDGGRTALVQPYQPSVDERGETALLFFDGRRSHAVAKAPILRRGAGLVEGLFAVERITGRDATPAEVEAAEAVLAAVPAELGTALYARVDLVEGDDGSPLLLELELTEPTMFLAHGDGAADRFAEAIAARLGR